MPITMNRSAAAHHVFDLDRIYRGGRIAGAPKHVQKPADFLSGATHPSTNSRGQP